MFKSSFNFTPKLYTVYTLPFIFLFFISISIISYFSLKNSEEVVYDVVTLLHEEITSRVKQHLDSYMNVSQTLNRINKDYIKRGKLDINNLEETQSHFWHQLKNLPNIGYISFGNNKGEHIGVGRNISMKGVEAGIVEHKEKRDTNFYTYKLNKEGEREELLSITPNFDSRTRPWYQTAAREKKQVWTDIYLWQAPKVNMSIATVSPLYDENNTLLGVFNVDLTLANISDFLSSIHVGNTGNIYIIERSGLVVASSITQSNFIVEGKKAKRLHATDYPADVVKETARYIYQEFSDLGEISTDVQRHFEGPDKNYFLQISPYKNNENLDWLIVVTVPEEDFMQKVTYHQLLTLFIIGIVLLLTIFIILFITRWVTAPMRELSKASQELAKGNWQLQLPKQRTQELNNLVDSLGLMSKQLKNIFSNLEYRVEQRTQELADANDKIHQLNESLKEENVRMSTELEITRQFQQLILPKKQELNQIKELDIAGFMQPASEVGGDYYDVLCYNDSIKIAIGDVTGHGLASGILMLMVQTAIRTLSTHTYCHNTAECLTVLNRALYDNIQRMETDKNLSLLLLNYEKGHIQLSGQHEEVLLVKKSGEIQCIDTLDLGFPIGLVEDISEFVSFYECKLESGDGLVLYTDGITEAENKEGIFYGLEHLCHMVKTNWSLPSEQIQELIIKDLCRHIGQQKVFDDITLLILKQN